MFALETIFALKTENTLKSGPDSLLVFQQLKIKSAPFKQQCQSQWINTNISCQPRFNIPSCLHNSGPQITAE